jgi:ADP-ribose pyrophosphatase
MERIDSKSIYEGVIAHVRVDEFRHADGTTSVREVVGHPGAVAIVAHDERFIYLVRQPREAVREEALLEVPAGKLDVPGEDPVECAKRELAEEVGKAASQWRLLKAFYTSPGFAEEEERIEIVAWPLDDLDGAIEGCEDAKSLIGLLLFRELRRSGEA